MSDKVKLILYIRGIKQVDIARALGVSGASVSEVVSGKKRSQRIEGYIAQLVGVKRQKLFGREEDQGKWSSQGGHPELIQA